MTFGITHAGVYFPRLRIDRRSIADAHAWMNPNLRAAARGRRAFCSWDEDAVTMAVEAVRSCVPLAKRSDVQSIHMASTTYPYEELSGSAVVAAASGLNRRIRSLNTAGSARAATSLLIASAIAQDNGALIVASDRQNPAPGGAAEMNCGAGAAAFSLGSEDVRARIIATASHSVHFVDQFRATGRDENYMWEERWVRDEGYMTLIPPVVDEVLGKAGICIEDVGHFVFPSSIQGGAKALAKGIGFSGRVSGDFEAEIGFCGSAHGAISLVEALAHAKAGDKILMIGFGQGVDAVLFEATELCESEALAACFKAAIDRMRVTADYLRMASFYGRIALDWGPRSEKAGKAALAEQYRSSGQLDTFSAGVCPDCGTVQFPVLAYCVNVHCQASLKGAQSRSLIDEPASIFTITNDWLSFHPAPPLSVGFVQFENGSRVLMEVVDAAPEEIAEGLPVEMRFRIKERDKLRGYNRYFWKATPA